MKYRVVAKAPILPIEGGFFSPVFAKDNSDALFIQSFGRAHKVRDFLVVDSTGDFEPLDIRRSSNIGSDVLFGYSPERGNNLVGTRDELAPRLREQVGDAYRSVGCADIISLFAHGVRPLPLSAPKVSTPLSSSEDVFRIADRYCPPRLQSILMPGSREYFLRSLEFRRDFKEFYILGMSAFSRAYSIPLSDIAFRSEKWISDAIPEEWEALIFKGERVLGISHMQIDRAINRLPMRLDKALIALRILDLSIRSRWDERICLWDHIRIEPRIFSLSVPSSLQPLIDIDVMQKSLRGVSAGEISNSLNGGANFFAQVFAISKYIKRKFPHWEEDVSVKISNMRKSDVTINDASEMYVISSPRDN